MIALFGKGYSAIESLGVVLLSCGITVLFTMSKVKNIIFKHIDYYLVGIIFIIQSLIGVLHFQSVINPDYFSTNILGVDIIDETYYFDIGYFGYLVDSIAQHKTEEGYFTVDLASGAIHKNYFLAYLISDLFYFGDAYALNFMVINILSIFYSGIVLALIAIKIFGELDVNKRRTIFYLTILQPIAWIPSHTMRDVFGAFLIVLSIGLIYLSVNKIQKIVFSILSLAIVFQHRSFYVLSVAGSVVLANFSQFKETRGASVVIICFLMLFVFLFLSTDTAQILVSVFSASRENSLLSGFSVFSLMEHFVKMIVGPFPWTQFYDGSVKGHAAFYSSSLMLQASWHITILYFLFRNIKKILFSKQIRNYCYVVILFAVPAIFSLGGHNFYLFPSYLLALPLLQMIPISRFATAFFGSICLYIFASALYFFLKLT